MSNYSVQYTYELLDKITPQLNKIQHELKQTGITGSKATKQMSKDIDRTTKSMGMLGKSVIGFAGGYLGIQTMRSITNTLANFGLEMAEVEAKSGATAEQMVKLTSLAQKLGSTTQFSASQVASAMKFQAMAGKKTNEILQMTPHLLNMSIAANMDFATASDIATDIMDSFALSTERTAYVTDLLAKSASSGNVTIGSLAEGIKMTGASAKMLNVPLNQVSAGLTILNSKGVKGTMAGTSLSRMMTRLAKVTPQAEEVLTKYGLTLDDVNIKKHGLFKVLQRVEPMINNTSDSFAVFGEQGVRAFSMLATGIPQLQKLSQELQNADGFASKTADTLKNTLAGDIKELKSAIEGLMLSAGDKGLTKFLRGAVQRGTGLVRLAGGDLTGFQAFVSGNQKEEIRASSIVGKMSPAPATKQELMSTSKELLSGELNINLGGLPAGSNVTYTPANNSKLQVKTNTAF